MPTDVPSIPPTTQTLRWIKADYSVTRDGGATGRHAIPSQVLPMGALIVAYWTTPLETFVSAGGGTLTLELGADALSSSLSVATLNDTSHAFPGAIPAAAAGSYPIKVLVNTAEITAGELAIYLLYLL